MAAIKRTQSANRERARTVLSRLQARYPDATCSLDFKEPLQLMVATILAAQCTDERVNIVTKSLFKKYRTANDYLNSPEGELEEAIHSCGFYRQKAKSIRNACKTIIEKFGGKVPGTMEELLTLDGVGRKTANVILGECFGVPGVIVDTHCTRLSNRLGFSKHDDPKKIEQDIMKILPRDDWRVYSHCMVFHGRAVCIARAPRCSECPVRDLCPFPDTTAGRKIAR
ncbi:MAG TPA: endonuclease III [Candidatus Hydrogenedentes bacterium]|nr:endonuclease III [Candidatus Hydrogenedentota bacterium]